MIVFLGPAGSGKSTQGKLLAERLGWTWLSAGQLLRDAHDKHLTEIMNEGQLAPSKIVNEMMMDAIQSAPDYKRVILDGFTRKIEEARHLVESGETYDLNVDLVLVFDVPLKYLLERLNLRARNDDTPDAVEERLAIFNEDIDEILDFFAKKNIKIVRIDGTGTVEEVYNLIVKELEKCQLN